MQNLRKTYTAEFKTKVVKEILREEKTLSQIGFLDTLSVPTCLNGAVTSWFDTGEPFVVEYPQ
jgi:hypothetical protein